MRHLRKINESEKDTSKSNSIDPLAYIFKYANDNFGMVQDSIKDLTQDQKIKYLSDSRDQIKNYLSKIDFELKSEINKKIAAEKDPIKRLEAWIAKPKHKKSPYVVGCFDSLGDRFLHDRIFQDRHVTHSVIDILRDYFADDNGNFVLGPINNDYNQNDFELTEKLIDDIIGCDVDEFTYDW